MQPAPATRTLRNFLTSQTFRTFQTFQTAAVFLLTSLMFLSCVQEPEGVIYSCDPPTIIETVPENGGEDFGLDDTIIFVFENPVDTLTVDTTTVIVIETSTGDTIEGDVFHEPCLSLPKRAARSFLSANPARLAKTSPLHDQPHPCGTLFFFDPQDSLLPGEEYTVILTTDILDTLGTELPEINTWTFTTEDTIPDPPPGVEVYPEPGDTNVPLDEVIEITFDTVWNPTLFDDSTIILTLGGDTIPGDLVYDPLDTSFTFTPTDSLLPDTTYVVIITVPDGPGGPMGPDDTTYTWTFTTEDTIADPESPPPPINLSVSDVHLLPPTLNWYASTGAVTYTLQVSKDAQFTTTVYNQSGITTPSHMPTGLFPFTTYYWRVSATNQTGTSAWSATRTFVKM